MAQDKLAKLHKRSVKIAVDEVDYYLRYDLNALVMLEEAYENIEEALNFEENPKGAIGKLRKVLYVGLQANHPDISEQEVGALFTVENLADFQEAIGKAMDAAMPEEIDEKKVGTPKDHLPKSKR
jgi:hypothetical protein